MRPTYILTLLLSLFLLFAGDAVMADARIIECNSSHHRPNSCAVENTIGAELIEQRSVTGCIKGKTWGYDRDGVWVRSGCRGRFRVEYGRNGRSGKYAEGIGRRDIFCASLDGTRKHCKTDVRGRPHLLHQFSRKGCREGKSWGVDRRGIWVDKGCVALFRVNLRKNPPIRRESFRCDSEEFTYVRCAVLLPSTIRFSRQISRIKCVKGQNWGVDDDGVWVKGGCSARFKAEIRISEPPPWLVGRFKGRDRRTGEEIDLLIYRNGKVYAKIEGGNVQAILEDDLLMLSGRRFVLKKGQNGFVAENTVSGEYHGIRFRRIK